jgi:hypothetical protein
MTSIKTVAAVALVALLVPVAAVAKETTIAGPQTLGGTGYFGGELTMTSDARPVKLVGRIDYVGVLDLGGDLRVACAGTGRVTRTRTANGVVHLCRGSGQLLATVSHFVFRGLAGQYRAFFPAGVTGVFRHEGGGRAATPQRRQDERERIPTVQELAALLAAKSGG